MRFLKLQEAKGMEAAEEAERLRRLREKVDAQESKLKRLRALRGQGKCSKVFLSCLKRKKINKNLYCS